MLKSPENLAKQFLVRELGRYTGMKLGIGYARKKNGEPAKKIPC